MFLIVVAAALCFSSFANGTPYTDCGSPYATIHSVTVTGCDPSQPNVCVLHKGTNASITIDYTQLKPSSKLNVRVWGIVAGLAIPYPMPYPNGCDDPDAKFSCPIASGTDVIYTAVVYISPSFPSTSATMKLELLDENLVIILCIKIDVQIQ